MRHLIALLSFPLCVLAETPQVYDLVIYGSTPAAVTAAVESANRGRKVVIVCPEEHIGGMTSNGLGWTDAGNTSAIGGMAREFYGEIWKHYQQPASWKLQQREDYQKLSRKKLINDEEQTMWTFEPHVAEAVFDRWLQQAAVTVERNQWLDRKNGITQKDGRITAIRTLSGKEFRGRIFVDTTYEGDLMAAAGVSYTTGREASSQYGETLNGNQPVKAVSHQFKFPVDPYQVPGDPKSGLLPRIESGPAGAVGEADKRLQAYCFRVCMSHSLENRTPFPKPEGYDPNQYELLLRYFLAGWDDWKEIRTKYDPMPNRKTDTNNHGAFSFDNIGMNYDYPDADYPRRKEIVAEHRLYQQGLLWFMANDSRVPESIRKGISEWGLPKDEFTDNGNWPRQLYIREARRMVSDFVVTERHLLRLTATPNSIGMGSYTIDSHNVRRYVDEKGLARNEGDIQIRTPGPYPIGYGSVIPKREECRNLFVPVCVSATHAAYGSIRMEPVFMILGQSVGVAADLAIKNEVDVQDVNETALSAALVERRQRLRAD